MVNKLVAFCDVIATCQGDLCSMILKPMLTWFAVSVLAILM